MADIQKIEGYWLKDASARKFIEDDEKAIAAAVSSILSGVGLDASLKPDWKLDLINEYGYQPIKEMIECVDTSLLNHKHGNITADGKIGSIADKIVVTTTGGALTSASGMNADLTNYSLNQLTTGSSTPTDNDYYISQWANGGTTTTTYHRRPVSALYTYMKGKMDSVYIPLSGSSAITGNLIPSTTNTRDLGSTSLYWNNAYVKTITSSNTVSATNGFIETSDINKKNVVGEIDLNKAYELIDKCSTIIYTLKDDPDLKEQIGTIAQEVQEFFPEIVETNEDGSLMLSYSRLTVVLMRVMKDLINRVQKLENKQ